RATARRAGERREAGARGGGLEFAVDFLFTDGAVVAHPQPQAPNPEPLHLILLGAPGAGKGTQGERLVASRGLIRISTGDLLRDAVRQGTALGAEARTYMDRGELVPDSVILGLVREVMRDGGAAGYVFDGFPRTIRQARGLDELLAELGQTLDAVVLVQVPDDVLVERLSGRRSCGTCGAVHNIYLDPPSVEGRCDRCGGALVERSDDEPATVRRRLEVYEEQTRPLIDYYRNSGVPFHVVDGDRPVEQVHADLEKTLAA
ncbi:MAG: adenylate kinase, partial [Longimicrobiales bacterium]